MKRFSKILSIILILAMIVPGIVDASGIDTNSLGELSNPSETHIEVEETEELEEIKEEVETDLDNVSSTVEVLETKELDTKEAETQRVETKDEKQTLLNEDATEVLAPKAPLNEDKDIERIKGENRVKTAIEISKKAYAPGTAKTLVLAGYDGSADALTGTSFAKTKNAPVLIAPTKTLSKEIKAEINRLGVKTVYILGGPVSVPNSIENELKALKLNVIRIDGNNRYETAAKIADEAKSKKQVFLAQGKKLKKDGTEDALADALAIGPVSAKKNMPVLLTQTNELSKATEDAIVKFAVKDVTIVGGEGVISQKVENKLKSMNINVTRVKGDNRYDTAIKVAKKYFSKPTNVIVANGENDADALVGGYFSDKNNAPILLTSKDDIDIEALKYVQTSKVKSIVLGGETVVSDKVFNEVKDAKNGKLPVKPEEPKPAVPEPKPEPKPEPEPVKPGKPIVCLDYGHGGSDPGAGYGGRREKDDTIALGKLVAKKLRNNGVIVDETRTTDVYVSLQDRVKFANKKDYNYFVSFHRNAVGPEIAHGVETWVSNPCSSKSTALAQSIQKNLVGVGFNDRKVKARNFYVVKYTKAPAVLIELGFIDHTTDNILYDLKQIQIVKGVTSAILGELGIQYKN